jgi:hypothetical protein
MHGGMDRFIDAKKITHVLNREKVLISFGIWNIVHTIVLYSISSH